MNKLSTAIAFTIAVIGMLLIPSMSPRGIPLANASNCSVSGSSQGTSTSSSSSSSSCACSVVASHGMVIVGGNCKPSCPPGHTGTPSTEDELIPTPKHETHESGAEVVVSGTCFPTGEDEPSSMEGGEFEPSDS